MGVVGYVLAFVAGYVVGVAVYKRKERAEEKDAPPEPPVPPVKEA